MSGHCPGYFEVLHTPITRTGREDARHALRPAYSVVQYASAIAHQMQRSQVLPGYPHSSAGAYGFNNLLQASLSLPSPPQVHIAALGTTYIPSKLSRSVEEARSIAAEHTLVQLGYPIEGGRGFVYIWCVYCMCKNMIQLWLHICVCMHIQ